MIKKVITTLDLSKVFGPDCILVVILNNCDPEIFIVVLVFNNVREKSFATNCHPVSLLSVVILLALLWQMFM